jgi:hypothetical protein
MKLFKRRVPIEDMDPDYVLTMFRFHMSVFHHNPDRCDECHEGFCSRDAWDNYDTWQLLVQFGEVLNAWMSGGGRLPRDWARYGLCRRFLMRR